ncbi:MAG: hypothetical protein KC766_12480 [Myxococcales bacterium]|nr:hypothetical protein [Myxococcales bacterium]
MPPTEGNTNSMRDEALGSALDILPWSAHPLSDSDHIQRVHAQSVRYHLHLPIRVVRMVRNLLQTAALSEKTGCQLVDTEAEQALDLLVEIIASRIVERQPNRITDLSKLLNTDAISAKHASFNVVMDLQPLSYQRKPVRLSGRADVVATQLIGESGQGPK